MCDSDMYLYVFVWSNSQNGEKMISERPATLEAIKRNGGEPIMASQVVVDQTQVGADGFLVANADGDAFAAQISAMEARAASRDKRAIASADEIEKYMLALESRELLKQARALKRPHTEVMAAELDCATDARDFVHFGPGLTT
jgi:hypothetical protein